MDVGQEQSSSHVVQIAWSPPGVAPHCRCALAILTANGLVSLWASLSDMTEPGSWKRVLVIKDIVEKPVETAVRSLAWGPTLSKMASMSTIPILAVGLDSGPEVKLLQVLSPFNSNTESWSAVVFFSITTGIAPGAESNGCLMNSCIDHSESVGCINFGPAWNQGEQLQTIISSASPGLITSSSITITHEATGEIVAESTEIHSLSIPHLGGLNPQLTFTQDFSVRSLLMPPGIFILINLGTNSFHGLFILSQCPYHLLSLFR